ncbi:uncharacterized protein LOC113468982 [Diaphorina citri]|uniref:Uncharacterized protein LOC113468982 n=1 Tax=Diaphorina citri TaxID=121845 RepID=A0A3Q0J0Y2_DIACI|nr:uncharacterized protein LOC113468982 [Diaphorina citri]
MVFELGLSTNRPWNEKGAGSSQVTASPPNQDNELERDTYEIRWFPVSHKVKFECSTYQDNVTLAPIFVLDGNLIPGSWCECRQTSNEDCMCHGAGLLEIPSNLSTTLKTLTVSNAGIRTLTANCLQPYKNTLRDVTFSNVKRLEHIEPGVTFSNVKRLEHIEPGVFNLLKELRSM